MASCILESETKGLTHDGYNKTCVARDTQNGMVDIVQIDFALKSEFVDRAKKVESEGCAWALDSRWIPPNP
jgi:hypothetical protein